VTGTTTEPLVAPLPSALSWASLPTVDGLVIGIGGDSATPVSIDPARPIIVMGPPGAARDAVESSLTGIAAARGEILDLDIEEGRMGMPRGIPPGTTVILVEPTDRTARELFRGDLDGLIDPRPPTRRVLVITGGEAIAAQVAEGPATGRGMAGSAGDPRAVSS
jgi:hypothetical protein